MVTTRRSARIPNRSDSGNDIDDADYPGPKRCTPASGRVTKSRRCGRPRKTVRAARIEPEVVIVCSDTDEEAAKRPTSVPPVVSTDDSIPEIQIHSASTPAHKSSKSQVSNKLKCDPIKTGRVRKPSVRRQLPFTEKLQSVLASASPQNIHAQEVTAIPTSPLSTQDSQDLPGDQEESSQATNLALGFEPTGPLLGREEESKELASYLGPALLLGHPSAGIYVCGTPGTGKTFTVSRVVKRLRAENANNCNDSDGDGSDSSCTDFNDIWVNCANLRQPRDLFPHLAEQLGISSVHQNPRESIRQYASSPGRKTLVVLDEVDFLTSRDQMVLYSAFEWPRIQDSRLVVVGIANSIDLPVRLLPWLRQAGCMPEIVSFAPYTSSALQAIVQQRIESANSSHLDAVAISLAAKKVAAGSGDARLMLDVCREAHCEMQREGNKKSCIAIVSSIITQRGGLSAAVDTIRQLPVQQQLALCVAANAVLFSEKAVPMKGKVNRKATLGGLYSSFERMCQRAHVSTLSFPEFADICCNALTHHGLVDVPSKASGRSAKTLRGRPIRLRVPIADVRAGIADKGFLPMLVGK